MLDLSNHWSWFTNWAWLNRLVGCKRLIINMLTLYCWVAGFCQQIRTNFRGVSQIPCGPHRTPQCMTEKSFTDGLWWHIAVPGLWAVPEPMNREYLHERMAPLGILSPNTSNIEVSTPPARRSSVAPQLHVSYWLHWFDQHDCSQRFSQLVIP